MRDNGGELRSVLAAVATLIVALLMISALIGL
jgi:hypothetical protein